MGNHLRLLSLLLLISILASACASAQATQVVVITNTPAPATATNIPQPSATLAEPAQTSTPSAPTPTPAGTWISLSPDTAAPGDAVQITGYLPGGATASQLDQYNSQRSGNVCWQGCLEGLVESGLPVTWSDKVAGYFGMQFIVPPAPWMGKNGPQALTAGDYTVGIQCIGPELQGCAAKEAQATATLHLKFSTAKAPQSVRCQSGQACGDLSFSPASAAPGMQVQVLGWAPLVSISEGKAYGYSLVLTQPDATGQPTQIGEVQQELDGSLTGSFQVPQALYGSGPLAPGVYTIALQASSPNPAESTQPPLIASTPFEITAAPTWGSLPAAKPIWIYPSTTREEQQISVDPVNDKRLAYCASGEIRLSEDGGSTWITVPTIATAALLENTPYTMGEQGSAGKYTCTDVVFDPTHADSLYATFQTFKKEYGAPPVFFMGFTTTDRGATWQMAPAPSPEMQETFGGFWTNDKVVQAMYMDTTIKAYDATAAVAESTSDGGATWTVTAPACPSSGPCLRWEPAPGSISGMGAGLPQGVMYSEDGGKTWKSTGQQVELRMPGPNELAALSSTSAVLLSSGDYPVLYTADSGKTWQSLGWGNLPGEGKNVSLSAPQLLPDGSLIAFNDLDNTWLMFTPGAKAWCSLAGAGLPENRALLRVSGDHLWWIPFGGDQPSSLPLSNLGCK